MLHSGIITAEKNLAENEFYLVSTCQRQGFACPSKYTILHNSTEEPLSKLHQLSYKLCHSYFNIANPVRLPAPILYARKLAKFMAERSRVVSMADSMAQSQFVMPSVSQANYARNAPRQFSAVSKAQNVQIQPLQIHQNFLETMPNLFFL